MKYDKKTRAIIKIIVNALTLTRVLCALLLPFFFYRINHIIAISILSMVLLSDFLDGILARKFSVCTKGGFHLDQASDKLLGILSIIVLIKTEKMLIIPLSLELAISLVNTLRAINRKSGSSSRVGKLKTFFFSLMLIFVALTLLKIEHMNTVATFSIVVTSVLELMTLIGYIKEAIKEKRVRKEKVQIKISDIKLIIKRLWNEEMFLSDRDKPIQLVIEEELLKNNKVR